MRRNLVGIVAGALLIPLAALAAYEAYAVARAKARTPALLAAVAAREVRLADIPARRLAMLLAVEDPGFYAHRGIDMTTPGAGRTTITQALVKRLYFRRFEPGFAKIEQSLISRFVLDPAIAKREQLELFLNYASFGNRRGRPIIGFADAARTYFGRDLAALDDQRFLALVAMLIGPNALDPIRHPRENARRVARIEAMLAGRCQPAGVDDVTYAGCDTVLGRG